ncbi:CHAT domain-containing protein [Seonamhaeicola maritimus]|uniref:CHAT domain-containing protein n=1 Tax=Seonamhaeicola maritimus TaxID=2591822 RepID=UPI0024952359|nr:CHAT domain-containing protein [Seonamhaeicola maritimus]
MDILRKHLIQIIFLITACAYPQSDNIKILEEKINQGVSFFQTNNFTSAKKVFEEALIVSDKIKDSMPWGNINSKYYYAITLFKLNDFKEAKSYFEKALQKAQSLDERNIDFEILIKREIANLYTTLGDHQKAISEQKQLNNFIKDQKGEKTALYAANVNNLGQMYFALMDCDAALGYYNTAKNIFLKLNLRTIDVATLFNNIGLCFFNSGKYIEADNAYLESYNIAVELKQEGTQFYSKLISNIAVLSQVQGDYENAKILCKQSLSILFDLNLYTTIEYANGLFLYGQLLKDLGKFDDALYEVKNAKKIYDKHLDENHLKFADVKSILAELHLKNGETKKALKYYEEASKLFLDQAPSTNPGYGYALNGLGNTYQVLGDYVKSAEYYLKALEHLKVALSEKHKDYGITLMNIGNVCAAYGDYSGAYDYLEQAIPVLKESIGTQNTTYGQLCLNILRVALINPDETLNDLDYLVDFALSIFTANDSKNDLFYNQGLFYKAIIYMENNKFNEALELLLSIETETAKHIDKDSQLYNDVITYIAINYNILKDYNNAFKYYKKYDEYLLNSVSQVFSFRSEKDKRTYLKKIEHWFSNVTSISLSKNFSNSEMTIMSLNNQLLRKGLLLNSSKDVITQLESLKKADINAKIKEYRSLKDLIIYLGLIEEIQGIEELNKVKSDLNRFETELVELYNSNFNTALDFKKDWNAIKKNLNENDVAIEFVSYNHKTKEVLDSDTNYIAYVITKNSQFPEVVELFNEQELKNILSKKSPKQLYKVRGSKGKSTTVSKGLYDVIWKPLEQYVKGSKTVYYSPVGLLNQIPFSAINAKEEEILSSKYNLVQLSSTSLLAGELGEPNSDNTLFIGGIDYEYLPKEISKQKDTLKFEFLKNLKGTRSLGATWDYLPGTLNEVQELQNLFGSNNKKYNSLTKTEATEEAFKKLKGNSPSVLHIATHGFFFENLPQEERSQLEYSPELVYKASEDPLMRSGLILAGANYAWQKGSNPYETENGILTALEISNLDLSNTDMVVLSACETGLGDIDGSEGVYGLQRAFKMAGVDIIVMSLWEVPDAETAEFMQLFYSNWLTGLKVRDAFNKTQRTMSNKYKDAPEKWAAFVLFE